MTQARRKEPEHWGRRYAPAGRLYTTYSCADCGGFVSDRVVHDKFHWKYATSAVAARMLEILEVLFPYPDQTEDTFECPAHNPIDGYCVYCGEAEAQPSSAQAS